MISSKRSIPELERVLSSSLKTWEEGHAERHTDREVYEFVAISRQVGAGGSQVASLLGEQLGWPVFDQEILHAMAGDDETRARMYARMDERDMGWIEQMMEYFIVGQSPPYDYFPKLTRTVLTLARGASAIYLGRGADLILPRGLGVRVRIVAPLERRIENYAESHGLDAPVAAKEVARIDRERSEFIRHHFGSDDNSPHRCDLIINLDTITPKQAAGTILDLLRSRSVIK